MLLGCCHCGNIIVPSIDSFSRSIDGSYTPSYTSNNCADNNCIYGIAAVNYRLVFNWEYNTPNTSGSCADRYINQVLSFVPAQSDINRCTWKTGDFGGKASAASGSLACVNHILPLATFVMAQRIDYVQSGAFFYPHRYSLRINAGKDPYSGGPQDGYLIYSSSLGASDAGSAPANLIDCTGTITLPLVYPTNPAGTYFAFYANYSAGGTVPVSVSLVPV